MLATEPTVPTAMHFSLLAARKYCGLSTGGIYLADQEQHGCRLTM